jgi:hypothetical protein
VIFSPCHVLDTHYPYFIVTGAPKKKKQIDGALSQEGFNRGHKPARQGKQIGIKHTREGIGRGRQEEEEGRESIGIRTLSSLSRETRAERGGILGMGPSSAMSASEAAAA